MSTYQTIAASELKKRLDQGEQVVMIDVREDEEVAEGMIPGAKHLPLGELPLRTKEIDRDSEVVFICRSGNRSGKACEYLMLNGFEHVVNMTGGMLAWNKL